MSRIFGTGIVAAAFVISLFALATESDGVQSLVRSQQFESAYKLLELQTAKDLTSADKALRYFGMGVLAHKLGWLEKAKDAFGQSLQFGTNLEDYVHFHLGKILRDGGHDSEAKQFFLKVEESKPRVTPLYHQAEYELGEIALKEGQWKVAAGHFNYLEKRMRSDDRYPQILWNLMRIEMSLRSSSKACRWATKLYSRYPSHPLIKEWGVDLQLATIDQKQIGCFASLEDQKNRIRNLQMQGVIDEAKHEIELIKSRTTDLTRLHYDTLMAAYLSADGKIDEALNLLLPHYKKQNTNSSYLMQLAQTAAKVGEFQMAVGAYYRAYQLNRNSKSARTALFQAAFLSYQFQDYDGASRKFEELMRRFPKSGLSRDAQWNLAWIHYLKGNYLGALNGFQKLFIKKQSRRQTTIDEKSLYWMAMSLLKMGKDKEASDLFGQLTNDKLFGYYALAAQARKMQFKDLGPSRAIASVQSKPTDLLPLLNQAAEQMAATEENESEDNEETLAISEDSDEDKDSLDTSTTGTTGAGGVLLGFKNPQLTRHMRRAQDLSYLGLSQWATWELLEIEKQTSNVANLKTLVSQYEGEQAFNRSSYIAQIYFSKQRSKGLSGEGRPFWQQAYPRAFDPAVTNYSNKFDVPEEFIWGIMRAESHYKYDVKSPVGAMGLMQVMPFTGKKLATMLGISNFMSTKLLEPEMNIQLGSRYLQRLLKTFDHKIPLAAAAYNAGPHRVRSWLKSFGKLDMDEFIEHIPFLETRNYVKKVVHNYQMYQFIYGKNPTVSLPWLAQPVGLNVEGKVESSEDWTEL